MSAGLLASTVTPGSTAPDASLTVPASDACAQAADGSRRLHASASTIFIPTRIVVPLGSVDAFMVRFLPRPAFCGRYEPAARASARSHTSHHTYSPGESIHRQANT